mmetsp:Transcript_72913/g.126621  ORF Transcript_72913/g.126621 Transcript_72913/m.126621 type:complete len:228 (-) Transcript_72913:119-802(-)
MPLENASTAISPTSKYPPRKSTSREVKEGGRPAARARTMPEALRKRSARSNVEVPGRGGAKRMAKCRRVSSSNRVALSAVRASSHCTFGIRRCVRSLGERLFKVLASKPVRSTAEPTSRRPKTSCVPAKNSRQVPRRDTTAEHVQCLRIEHRTASLPEADRMQTVAPCSLFRRAWKSSSSSAISSSGSSWLSSPSLCMDLSTPNDSRSSSSSKVWSLSRSGARSHRC